LADASVNRPNVAGIVAAPAEVRSEPMNVGGARSFGLLLAVACAGVAPFLVNCAGTDEYDDDEYDDDESNEALTGMSTPSVPKGIHDA
jgi:hypothetical protein